MFNVFSNEAHSPVAQLAEQQTVNLWVRSSSLRGGAKPSFNKLGFFFEVLTYFLMLH